jgi:ATP-dependent protease HslVU (ClpYQ) peptidase subunit
MTAIAAIEHGGKAHIAGDSSVLLESTRILQRSPKVFRCGPIIVGIAGLTAWEAMWRKLKIVRMPGRDVDAWVADELATSVIGAIASANIEDKDECAALGGIGGRVYYVEGDGNPWRPAHGYAAIGEGADVALGSLHTTAKRKLLPRYRLTLALQASAAHCSSVSPPFRFVST